jgi:hypothetical protein
MFHVLLLPEGADALVQNLLYRTSFVASFNNNQNQNQQKSTKTNPDCCFSLPIA